MKFHTSSTFQALSLVAYIGAHGGVTATGLSTPKIDTHSHIYPDWYKQAVTDAGWVPGPDGNPGHPTWNVSLHLGFMAANNIEKSYVSCSSPGTNLYPNDSAANLQLTREMNNFTADLKRQYPTKFGFFASLPLPDIDAALAEIDRAYDELDADGFVFLSNHWGLYHGDPRLAPVYEKLDARKAVIFIHPTVPCPRNAPTNITGTPYLDYAAPLSWVFAMPTMEFIFDTARTVADLILSGTVASHANVKWIIPHCGGVLPAIFDRFLRISSLLGPKLTSDRPAVPYNVANATALLEKQFWFDLAGFSMSSQIFAMARLWGANKFLYGSDFVFTAAPAAIGLTREINATLPELYNETEISWIFRGNAVGLLGK